MRIPLMVIAITIIALVSIQCSSEAASPTELANKAEIQDLGPIKFGRTTYNRYADHQLQTICYQAQGYHDAYCVYVGQGAGYPNYR
ncbi:hypothetical protein LCGC14_2373770 [marine sediment metagenome]|uniref:Uncharacterized protein n=1 Tax=marine sediment metagenome TaxID=412755 RepID=A0A0F9EFC8_9ZZZZ